MTEYIERDAALKKQRWSFHTDENVVFVSDIAAIPAADVMQVRHGRWDDVGDFEQCSVCHGTHLKEVQTYYGKAIWLKMAYCPNCGAKMDGGR